MMKATLIMITVLDGDVNEVFWHLYDKLPVHFATGKDNDLFYYVPPEGCGFSLKQLKEVIAEVASADVNIADLYENHDVVMYDLTY